MLHFKTKIKRSLSDFSEGIYYETRRNMALNKKILSIQIQGEVRG